MINLVIVLGGMLYAGYQARQEQRAKLHERALAAPAPTVGVIAPPVSPPPLVLEDFQEEYRKRTDHYLGVTVVATGVSFLSIIYPPAGLVSTLLLTYLAVPVFKAGYHSVFSEKRVRFATVDAIVWAALLISGLNVLNSVSALVYFGTYRLVRNSTDRSRQKISNAFAVTPRKVWVVHDGQELEVEFESLQVGDVLVLQAGELAPIDGRIVQGMAAVDQRMLTGEAHPVEKLVGDRISATTLVVSGRICVEVERTGAETQAASIQSIIDRTTDFTSTVETRAVVFSDSLAMPTMVAGGLTTVVFGPSSGSAVLGSNFSDVNRLSAPLGMLNFLEVALDHGILVKDGRCLEVLRDVDTVIFDKTGTLTLDQPHVGTIHVFGDHDADALLRFAAAAEAKHVHPIARAIMAEARSRNITAQELDEASYEMGLGVRVSLQQHVVHVGSARFMQLSGNLFRETGRADDLMAFAAEHGATIIYVAVDGCVEGALELHSTLRPEAMTTIKRLRDRGLEIVIVSGDHEGPTRSLAHRIGIQKYFSEILPGDKAEIVRKLRDEGRSVCFVGDGVNDSVALKTSNVSISIHGASDAAIDVAGVVLLDGTLNSLAALFELSDEVHRIQKLDYYVSSVPGVAGVAGVIFLGFGMAATLTMFIGSVSAAVLLAMWPKYSRKLGLRGDEDREWEKV